VEMTPVDSGTSSGWAASGDAAELSSLVASVEDLQRRSLDIARRYEGTTRDDVLAPLYEVDRSLASVVRKLNDVMRLLR
jgi:hypothetical protein